MAVFKCKYIYFFINFKTDEQHQQQQHVFSLHNSAIGQPAPSNLPNQVPFMIISLGLVFGHTVNNLNIHFIKLVTNTDAAPQNGINANTTGLTSTNNQQLSATQVFHLIFGE